MSATIIHNRVKSIRNSSFNEGSAFEDSDHKVIMNPSKSMRTIKLKVSTTH